jgi:hypothetical protein
VRRVPGSTRRPPRVPRCGVLPRPARRDPLLTRRFPWPSRPYRPIEPVGRRFRASSGRASAASGWPKRRRWRGVESAQPGRWEKDDRRVERIGNHDVVPNLVGWQGCLPTSTMIRPSIVDGPSGNCPGQSPLDGGSDYSSK